MSGTVKRHFQFTQAYVCHTKGILILSRAPRGRRKNQSVAPPERQLIMHARCVGCLLVYFSRLCVCQVVHKGKIKHRNINIGIINRILSYLVEKQIINKKVMVSKFLKYR